jgi:DNA polymerase I-like protein with 3'-5' exonuclease and polymerase domains
MPIKSTFRYIRLPRIRLYGDQIRLRYPLVKYSNSGPKILIISDALSVEEAQEGKLFSGNVGTIISSAFDTAIKYEGASPSRVLSVTTRQVRRPSKLSDAQVGRNNRRIIKNYIKLIERWKPEVVVFLGFQNFLRIWRPYVKTTERSYTAEQLIMLRGRVIPTRIGQHTCNTVLSFSPRAVASQLYKDYKGSINLLGFTIEDFAAAIRNNNRYTVPEIDSSRHKIILTIEEFDKLYDKLLECRTPCIDTETDNLNRVKGNRLLVVLFCLDGKTAYLLPIHHPETPFLPNEIKYIIAKLRRYFEQCVSNYTTYHTAKFDITQFFTQLKLRYYNHRIYDIAVGEYFLDENRKFMRLESVQGSYTLETIGAKYGALGYEDSPIKKSDRDRMADFSLADTLAYGDKDVIYLWHAARFQIAEAKRRGDDYSLFMESVCELGSDTILDFVEMETNGVLVDHKYLTSLMAPNSQLMLELDKLRAEFRQSKAVRAVNARLLKKQGVPEGRASIFSDHNGRNDDMWIFDVNKQEHQQELYFRELGIEPMEYRKDGGGKTNKAFLLEYKDTVPEVALLEKYRQHDKLRNTYVMGLFKQLTKNPDHYWDNRLRAVYNFLMILTTRSSAQSPNLQNIPSRGPLAKIIKRLFICTLGYLLIKVDYSAHEVRGWANISGDHQIAAAFAEGMKLRLQIRLVLALDPDLDYRIAAYVKEVGWNEKTKDDKGNKVDKHSIIDKRKLAKRLGNSDPDLAKILELLIELQIKGDVHRMNYQFFFDKPAETVTDDERQGVKEVVFGVVYGKQARALAESLYKKFIKPIRQKYMPRIRVAMKDDDEVMVDRLNKKMYREIEPYYKQAQDLIDKLANKFKRGWGWLEKIQREGQENLRVVSVFGAVRHLFAYLHTDPTVQHMMDRRGPNSLVQGPSSNLIFTAARLMNTFNWMLRRNKINLGYRNCNSVHDSNMIENKIATIPLTLYYMEHSLTTQNHRRVRKTYGFNMIIGLEIEFEIGGCEAAMSKWDFTESSLMESVGSGIDWVQKELGHKLDKKSLLSKVQHNYRIVNQFRIKELKKQGDGYAPTELMLMTPEIAAQQNWKY